MLSSAAALLDDLFEHPAGVIFRSLLIFLLEMGSTCADERHGRWRMLESVQSVLTQRPFGVEGPLSCVSVSAWELWPVAHRCL